MFYFGNYSWDPNQDFKPIVNPQQPYQIALIVLASVISFGALVATAFYCFIDIKKFYTTQEAYWKTDKFKHAKDKALYFDF